MDDTKVLIKLIVPEIDSAYDVFLPVGRKIGSIIELLNKVLKDMSDGDFKISNKRCLYNRYNKTRYNFNSMVYETDIRNDTILVLI